ncbi:hypothetical protein JB92DRAFT_2837916 [Gautieria morchelliformis]|nr:hypothetical protein JB92DRAFT_2837916 [Gautieria morchelliformis]
MRSLAVSLYVLALTNVAFSAPTPADVHSKVVCRLGRRRGHHRVHSTTDRNGGFFEPFGAGDNCIDAEGDRFNGRHFGEGRGRFGDESVGNGGFGPDGNRSREDHFGEDPLHHGSRPDDRFHGGWEHGVEQDGGKRHGSDESGSKQSDGKHTHGKYPKSDGPHSVRKIAPRALGDFSGNGNGAFVDGEKFGDLPPKYVEGEESGGQQPRIYADGEEIGDRPKWNEDTEWCKRWSTRPFRFHRTSEEDGATPVSGTVLHQQTGTVLCLTTRIAQLPVGLQYQGRDSVFLVL